MGNTRDGVGGARSIPVHPHVHGEHVWAIRDGGASAGSSPRTWGTPRRRLAGGYPSRFIPTYMGNTLMISTLYNDISVHPHVHGEHTKERKRRYPRLGSSPRTWGTPHRRQRRRSDQRFIPTYMGNTRDNHGIPVSVSVHPHVHGEHVSVYVTAIRPDGSSPRTWGTHSNRAGTVCNTRFIPTYMGNTVTAAPNVVPPAVHPHVHGEHLFGIVI